MARRVRHLSNDNKPPNSRPRVSNHSDFVLGGGPNSVHTCLSCFCDPCIAEPTSLPSFIRGSASPDPSNVAKRFRLYKKTWSFLRRVGLWDFPPYKDRKQRLGHRNSPRDIIPWCIKHVSSWIVYCCNHCTAQFSNP